MADIQFEVITDLAVLNPQHIETNFDQVREYLSDMMAPYAALVVTEDSVADAKKDLAKLRKLRDGINAQKIAVKKEWMKPYNEYEAQPKELMEIIDKAICNIDGQVKDYDSRRKEQKMAELKAYFEFEACERGVLDYLDWTRIKNIKWANASVTVDAAQSEIFGIIDNCVNDLNYIRGLNSPFETAMLDEYRKSLDLRFALSVGERLKTLQEAEERKKAERVAETFLEEQGDSGGSPADSAPIQTPPPQFIRRIDEDEPPKPKTYELNFHVVVTMQQAHALKQFFTEQGIEYHKI